MPFRFGDFALDPATGALYRSGRRVPLQPQPARLLLLLVERAGQIVTRDEIRAALWTDVVVEYDLSINYCVRQIRSALGDEGPRLVQAVPRRGYRFVGSVQHDAQRTCRGRLHQSIKVAVAVAMLMAVFAGGFTFGATHSTPGRPFDFVYLHLTGRANCPYWRFLSPFQRSS